MIRLQVRAFVEGVREFRLGTTTAYGSPVLIEAYDRGREAAHRLTLRRFEA